MKVYGLERFPVKVGFYLESFRQMKTREFPGTHLSPVYAGQHNPFKCEEQTGGRRRSSSVSVCKLHATTTIKNENGMKKEIKVS